MMRGSIVARCGRAGIVVAAPHGTCDIGTTVFAEFLLQVVLHSPLV